MQNGIIIEIAVAGLASKPFPFGTGLRWPEGRVDHYWRTRWVEDGEEVDAIEEIKSLAEMARDVRAFAREGEPVAWRYYETGVGR